MPRGVDYKIPPLTRFSSRRPVRAPRVATPTCASYRIMASAASLKQQRDAYLACEFMPLLEAAPSFGQTGFWSMGMHRRERQPS